MDLNKQIRKYLPGLGIYFWSLGVLLYAHYLRIEKDAGLIGEELSVAFRNVRCLETRIQADSYATNFSANIFYWIGSYILPLTVNSQRIFKIIFVAFIPVLIFGIISRLKVNCSMLVKVFPGILFSLLPGIVWYSIMSTEYIVDCFFSFLLFILALDSSLDREQVQKKANLVLFILLSVFVAHFYADSLPVLLVSWLIFAFNVKQKKLLVISLVPAVLFALWPLIFFKNDSLIFLFGGGKLDLSWSSLWENLQVNFNDLFIIPDSYLFKGEVPFAVFQWDRGGVFLGLLSLLGIVENRSDKRIWYLGLIAILSVFLSVVSGTAAPGVRRMIPFVIVFCIFVGLGVESLLRISNQSVQKGYLIFGGLLVGVMGSYWPMYFDSGNILKNQFIIGYLVFLVLAAELIFTKLSWFVLSEICLCFFLVVPLNSYLVSFDYVSKHYVAWLQREFKNFENLSYVETLDYWARVLAEREVEFEEKEYAWDYVVTTKLICERRYQTCKQVFIRDKPRKEVVCLD